MKIENLERVKEISFEIDENNRFKGDIEFIRRIIKNNKCSCVLSLSAGIEKTRNFKISNDFSMFLAEQIKLYLDENINILNLELAEL